ncbi:rhomboid family intramembrane serine protease [Streptomyces kaniharaensis]|uniref:Rhomboid family intramembrane serine protease n=1 Tax=Streptomyces kaniharaensis TaxID=212423 RepID=A0A6N7KS77_9ACTN|nr:rhomboid family intramembrane serine protease [Streptomyces kaniharaensis]MQS13177.1 rhomboid family intramembrane serine protease [Streptomyces kaniharaensis]
MLPDEPRPPADRTQPTGPEAGLPGCYRHPETATGISCTRCGHPICPQCMVPASVGFQCPDCVSGGHARTRQATTRFGGTPAADGALVSKVLIGINIAVFLLAAYVFTPWLAQDWSLFSAGRAIPGGPVGVADGPGQWYRLLTATFLHLQLWHIGANMLALWWTGPVLETVLGRLRFLALYLVSGLAGSAFAFLVAGDLMNSLGASGAIYGLFGATLVLQIRTRGPIGPVMALLVFNLILTFSMAGIDWRAHLGGLVVGALTATGLMFAPRERRGLVQGLTVAGAAAVIVAMVLIGMARYGA